MHPFLVSSAEAFGLPVCRLGLASYGQTEITADDVLGAVDRGVNFLTGKGWRKVRLMAYSARLCDRKNIVFGPSVGCVVADHEYVQEPAFGHCRRQAPLITRHTNSANRSIPLGSAEIPIIAYTALRWGALLRPTPDDPPGYAVPRAPDWYRFVLQHPAVTVTLAAPQTRFELTEDHRVLETEGPLAKEDYAVLAQHGERVHRHAGRFR